MRFREISRLRPRLAQSLEENEAQLISSEYTIPIVSIISIWASSVSTIIDK